MVFARSILFILAHKATLADSRLLNPSILLGRKPQAPNPTRIAAASTSRANTSCSASAFRASLTMAEPEVAAATAAAMETEAAAAAGQKREREEEGDGAAAGGETAAAEEVAAVKKQKVEGESKEEKEGEDGKPVKLGPKEFASSLEMFDYFFGLLHSWSPQVDFNKYEHMVLEDLLKKGSAEPNKKIGPGIEAFEIRNHPVWRSVCFFIRRVDGSSEDFSFRKCVDNILPLPEDMKIGSKKPGGHHKGGGGRGGGRGGGGRGGRGRGRRGS